MAQYETYTNKFFSSDLMRGMMPSSSMMPFDLAALMETQRKNFQAISEIHQNTVEGLQAVAQLQTEILSQFVQDNTTMAQQIMAEGTPEEKVALQADMVRKAYEHSMNGMSELGDLIAKSGKETGEIINKRVTASLTEFKSSVQKSKSKAA